MLQDVPQVFTLLFSVLYMHSKAWLTTRVPLRLARMPRTASSAQRSRRLRSTRAVAPALLAHAEVTKNTIRFSMGPKRRYPAVALREYDFHSLVLATLTVTVHYDAAIYVDGV